MKTTCFDGALNVVAERRRVPSGDVDDDVEDSGLHSGQLHRSEYHHTFRL